MFHHATSEHFLLRYSGYRPLRGTHGRLVLVESTFESGYATFQHPYKLRLHRVAAGRFTIRHWIRFRGFTVEVGRLAATSGAAHSWKCVSPYSVHPRLGYPSIAMAIPPKLLLSVRHYPRVTAVATTRIRGSPARHIRATGRIHINLGMGSLRGPATADYYLARSDNTLRRFSFRIAQTGNQKPVSRRPVGKISTSVDLWGYGSKSRVTLPRKCRANGSG